MPIVDGKVIGPDEAAANGRCPECGKLIAETNGEHHVAEHWPREFPPEAAFDEGRRRRDILRKLIAAQSAPKPAATE